MADLIGQTVSVSGYGGIAWDVIGYLTEEIYDAEIDDFDTITNDSLAVCIMVGDDRRFTFDVDDLTVIDDEDYCSGCGQIGCSHGG